MGDFGGDIHVSLSLTGICLILAATNLSISFFRGSWLLQDCLIRVFLIPGGLARSVGWLGTSHSSAEIWLVGLKCGAALVIRFAILPCVTTNYLLLPPVTFS